jgi:hypothetical protein
MVHLIKRPFYDMKQGMTDVLPYRDTKPKGAADFYFAINTTFRFIEGRFGREGLVRYWRELGKQYMRPVWERWNKLGFAGIASYWKAFFEAEPGAEVIVHEYADRVELEVAVCPMIRHLREGGREILPCLCQHCYFISDAAAAKAGYTIRVEGGAGACRQTFYRAGAVPPQDLAKIKEVTC